MSEQKPEEIEELSYEQAFSELEGIVTVLEAGEKPLEESLSLFERGQKLIRYCNGVLSRAELKVQELSGDSLQPFQENE